MAHVVRSFKPNKNFNIPQNNNSQSKLFTKDELPPANSVTEPNVEQPFDSIATPTKSQANFDPEPINSQPKFDRLAHQAPFYSLGGCEITKKPTALQTRNVLADTNLRLPESW